MHKRFSYRMTGDRLEVHTGVIYTHHKAMPVSSVKYLSTFDGPFERLCGLTNLMVFAAGSFVVLAGLTKEQEAELRRRLLKNGMNQEGTLWKNGPIRSQSWSLSPNICSCCSSPCCGGCSTC